MAKTGLCEKRRESGVLAHRFSLLLRWKVRGRRSAGVDTDCLQEGGKCWSVRSSRLPASVKAPVRGSRNEGA